MMTRFLSEAWEYIRRVLVALSILLNAVACGRSNQTFSARNYEWWLQGDFNMVPYIDFLLGKDHCYKDWFVYCKIEEAKNKAITAFKENTENERSTS